MVKKLELYNFYKNKKILITGHTGFKGSWMTLWLLMMGSKIVGISKNIPTKPSNFEILKLKKKIKNYFFDIKNLSKLKKTVSKEKPDIIFHFAAQAILSESYKNPIDTVNVNTIGSLNILHSASFLKKKCVCYAFNVIGTKLGDILMSYKKDINLIVQINNKIIQKNSDFNLIIKDAIV